MFTCNMCSIDFDCVFNNPYKNNIDMKAPEKLYIALNELTEDGRTFVLDHRVDYPTCTEYTRTDVFIEKAKKWFEMQNEGVDSDGNYKCDMTDFEDFRNYMEGE